MDVEKTVKILLMYILMYVVCWFRDTTAICSYESLYPTTHKLP